LSLTSSSFRNAGGNFVFYMPQPVSNMSTCS
jgi:hypothetical protein